MWGVMGNDTSMEWKGTGSMASVGSHRERGRNRRGDVTEEMGDKEEEREKLCLLTIPLLSVVLTWWMSGEVAMGMGFMDLEGASPSPFLPSPANG